MICLSIYYYFPSIFIPRFLSSSLIPSISFHLSLFLFHRIRPYECEYLFIAWQSNVVITYFKLNLRSPYRNVEQIECDRFVNFRRNFAVYEIMSFKRVLIPVLLMLSMAFGQNIELEPKLEPEPEPELVRFSPSQVKTVGEGGRLECVLYNVNASVHQISWLMETNDPANPHKLLTRGSSTISDNRYAVKYYQSVEAQSNRIIGIFRLLINNLIEDDSGTYFCNVHLSDTTRLEGRIELTVEPAATPTNVDQHVDTTTVESALDSTQQTESETITSDNGDADDDTDGNRP